MSGRGQHVDPAAVALRAVCARIAEGAARIAEAVVLERKAFGYGILTENGRADGATVGLVLVCLTPEVAERILAFLRGQPDTTERLPGRPPVEG